MRPRRCCLIFQCPRRDRDSTKTFGQGQDPRYLFTRPRLEPTFNEEIDKLFASIFLKIIHPGQDETETRLSKIEANEMRLAQFLDLRRDQEETSSKILYKTESLSTFGLKTATRPRPKYYT